ncbi:MAG: metal ABC transporter substrate-binding protein [bacterium]|nr:metal ABC transporter substrate-binding protein [bacterium]
MKKTIGLVALVLSILIIFSGCKDGSSKGPEDDDVLRVVTTIFPQYDFVRQIAGDRCEIEMLLPNGAESHFFEPTTSDLAVAGNSDLFIYVGGNFDIWAEKVIKTCKISRTIALLDITDVVAVENVEGIEPHQHSQESENYFNVEYDEHVWTSPQNAIKISKKICETLCEIAPEYSGEFTQNCTNFVAQLQELDADFTELVQNAPKDVIVCADRFPFRYFTDRYNLKYYAAFNGCSTDNEVSLSTLNALVNKVNENKIDTVFHIEFSSGTVADSVCEQTGAEKKLLHSCHNVTEQEFNSGVTYIDLMRKNYDNLKEALY